jgi:hypothetical protein
MEIYVYTPDFINVCIIDTYQSFIWTDRLNEPGDFELYTPVTQKILDYCVEGNYLSIKDSEYTMIIENREIRTDLEDGPIITITGRSLESILGRRIIWSTTNLDGNLQNGIKTLINDNIISPSIADRAISNFVFKDSEDDKITSLTMDNQYTGDNLLEVIEELCSTNKIGFRILLNDDNEFEFELYAGVDMSYNQDTVPWIVFSPNYENLLNSVYKENTDECKNVALVAGEDQSENRVTRVVGEGSGLTRRELYVDARDLRSNDISTSEYYQQLDERGKEKLNDCKVEKKFESECETTKQFEYGVDFKLGDIVQVENEYGIGAPARITEFIISDENDDMKRYPTFEIVEDEET